MSQEQHAITYHRLFDGLSVHSEETRMFKKVVSIGSMISSAVASPILFELKTTRTWIFDILIFFIGSACFMLQNQEEISQYGPYALAAYTCFGLGAYSSARTTLSELVPWIPISLCISFLLTVFFPPKIRELRGVAENNDILMEEGRSVEFQRSEAQPGSILSDGDIQSREQTLMTTLWLRDYEHDVAYTLGRPASRYSNQSHHDSTIILGEFEDLPYRAEHTVRSRQAENTTGAHSQAFAETLNQSAIILGTEPRDYPRSISPDSISAASSGRPLL